MSERAVYDYDNVGNAGYLCENNNRKHDDKRGGRMSKYIDAEYLITRLNRMWEERQLTNTKHKTFTELLAVEPEAIIRCKDCKLNIHNGCNRIDAPVNSDDFCSYGKRKE